MTLLRLTSSHVEVAAIYHSTYDFILSISSLHAIILWLPHTSIAFKGTYYACASPKLFLRKPRSLTNSTTAQNTKRTSSSLAIWHPHCLTLWYPSTTSWMTCERRQDILQKQHHPPTILWLHNCPPTKISALVNCPPFPGVWRANPPELWVYGTPPFPSSHTEPESKEEMEIRHKDLILNKKKKERKTERNLVRSGTRASCTLCTTQ